MSEQELRKHRCCFTGHRPEKLNISEEQLCVRLGLEIDRAIEDGFTTFISGMAKGVDICAAELVLKRRVSDARLKLICALPYENFGLHWSASWTDRYVEVIWHADTHSLLGHGKADLLLQRSGAPSLWRYPSLDRTDTHCDHHRQNTG